MTTWFEIRSARVLHHCRAVPIEAIVLCGIVQGLIGRQCGRVNVTAAFHGTGSL